MNFEMYEGVPSGVFNSYHNSKNIFTMVYEIPGICYSLNMTGIFFDKLISSWCLLSILSNNPYTFINEKRSRSILLLLYEYNGGDIKISLFHTF